MIEDMLLAYLRSHHPTMSYPNKERSNLQRKKEVDESRLQYKYPSWIGLGDVPIQLKMKLHGH
jgi:hypothetical protein